MADEFDLLRIDVPEDAVLPDTIVKFLAGELVRLGRLPQEHADPVVCAVLRREAIGSTGVGRGLAFPHAASDLIDVALGIVGRLPEPVAWQGAIDNQPVHTVCLLITPKSDTYATFKAMEAVARRLRQEFGL